MGTVIHNVEVVKQNNVYQCSCHCGWRTKEQHREVAFGKSYLHLAESQLTTK